MKKFLSRKGSIVFISADRKHLPQVGVKEIDAKPLQSNIYPEKDTKPQRYIRNDNQGLKASNWNNIQVNSLIK